MRRRTRRLGGILTGYFLLCLPACTSTSRTQQGPSVDSGSGATGGGGASGDASASGGAAGSGGQGGAAGSGGGTAGDASASGGAAGACAGSDAGSGLTKWPDSATEFCTDGASKVLCSATSGAFTLQDGATKTTPPAYSVAGSVEVLDNVTSLTWRTDYVEGKMLVEANSICGTIVPTGQWRVPTLMELVSIVDYGRANPSIDTKVFTLGTDTFFWTSSSFHTSRNAVVNFDTGGVTEGINGDQTLSVRCVKGKLAGAPSAHSCGAALDPRTGLMWWKASGTKKFTWTGALNHCDKLSAGGFTDWRLPNVKELQTLLDDSVGTFPAIDDLVFGNDTEAYGHWTSTAFAGGASLAFVVDFNVGGFGPIAATLNSEDFHLRCVRDLAP